jgi:thioesterase domain-containing protein
MTDADLADAESYFHQQIPITRAMGIRIVPNGTDGFSVEAPVELNSNHLATAFGGSINAVATLAGYGLLWFQLRGTEGIHLVISESSIRFLRPVTAVIRATCRKPSPDALRTFRESISTGSRARIQVAVTVEGADDSTPAAFFTATFVALPHRDAVSSSARPS